MRDDQFHRLQAIEEKLTDQLLSEADPDNWSANGVLPKDMTQHERGDRYWCKKNAVATVSLAVRIQSLIGQVQRAGSVTPGSSPEDDSDDAGAGLLDAEINAAEREAQRLLAKMKQPRKAPSAS